MYFEEKLSGGLVTSIDPAELEPGELVRADNCLYFPTDTAVYRAPGLQAHGYFPSSSVAQQALYDLVPVRFEGGQQYLVAQTADSLYYIDPETSGALTSGTPFTSGAAITAVHFANRWYFFNGVNDNVVMASGPRWRRHGLNPITSPPAGSTASSAFALSTSGTYEYWYTEVAKYAEGDEVESAFTGTPTRVLVADPTSAHAPVLTFPSQPLNTEATHYRIYRGAARYVAGEPSNFPIGYMVGERTTATTGTETVPVWTNGGTPANSSGYAASYDADTTNPFVGSHPAGTGEFVTETAVTGAPNSTGTVYQNTAPGSTKNGRMLMVYNFGLLPAGNILGLTVDVVAKATDPTKTTLYASVCERSSANTGVKLGAAAGYTSYNPQHNRRAFTGLGTSFGTLSVGSATDDWLPSVYSWTADQVASSAFAVCLWAEFAAGTPSSATITIDSVKLTVRSNSASDDEFGRVYDSIALELGGESLNFSAKMPPPKASVGTVFQNSLVTNDVANPRRVVWSNPGEPDSFVPDAYYLDDFGGNQSDEIKYIGVVSGRCVVAMLGSCWRINYLPNENDASIVRGDAVSPISTSDGVANPRAACTFSMPGMGEVIALAGASGIFVTDGLTLEPISDGLDWGSIIGSPPNVSNIKALINEPGTKTLRLLLGTGDEYCMSYARKHRTRFGGKWTGPNAKRWNTRKPSGAAAVRLASGIHAPFYCYASSASSAVPSIARDDAQDTGYSSRIRATDNNYAVIQTRDLYPGGRDAELELHDLMWYGEALDQSADTPSPLSLIDITRHFLNEPSETDRAESAANSGAKLVCASITEGRCSGFSVKMIPFFDLFGRLYSVHPNVEGFGSADNA